MDLRLAGKRVLVTGGSRGIGRAAVLAFVDAGAQVVTCCRAEGEDAADLSRHLKESGGPHRLVFADVTGEAGVAQLTGACAEALGGLDVVVNNVGIDGHAALPDLSSQEWGKLIDTNLGTCFRVTQAALPLLADGGSVIFLGSSAALRGRPESAHYTASKAALTGLTRSLAKELGDRSVRVNVVAAGAVGDGVPPPLRERLAAMTALGRLATTDDIAGAILFLASDLSRYVTGSTLHVDGGI
jgi:3-oxoacyl-[acyl-carrier protein] reductase